MGLLWCFAWWWVVRDSPEDDRAITDEELEYLRTAIGVSSQVCFIILYKNNIALAVEWLQESLMSPPWKAMMTSKAVWAIILAHFAENWGFYTLLTGLPMFMRGKPTIWPWTEFDKLHSLCL